MAKKEYNVMTRTRTARRRSENKAEKVSEGASQGVSIAGVSSGGGTSSGGHSHGNKGLLDALQRDEERYLYLREYDRFAGEEGTGEYVSEKVKAGYADTAGDTQRWNGKEMSKMMDQPVRTTDDVKHKNVTATEKLKGTTFEGESLKMEKNATIAGDVTVGGSAEVKSITVRENAEIKGNANVSGNVDANKVTSDSLITSSIKTRYFNDSIIVTGGGFGLYEDEETGLSKLVIDDIAIRNKMIVTTLEIQELYSVGGQMVLSKASGEIEKVDYDAINKRYNITIKDWDKNPQFKVYDWVRCSRWDNDDYDYVNYCVSVHSTTDNGIIVEAVHFNDTKPMVGDNLVHFGNVYDTSRQAIIIIGVADGKPQIDVYDGISSNIISISNNLKARMGDLGGIVDDGVELSGYGIWTNNLHIGSKIADTFNLLISPIETSIANINNDVTDINKRIDGVVENWFYKGCPMLNTLPTSEWETEDWDNHVGDTYTNVNEYEDAEGNVVDENAGKSWRWVRVTEEPTGYEFYEFDLDDGSVYYYYWQPIADSDAVKALLEASKAQETADGKARTFVNTPYPPYDLGDLWVQGTAGDILKCVKAKIQGESFANSDWAKASKYTDDTALNDFVNGDFVTYKTEVQKQFDVTNESFTSIYKANTSAIGNLLLGTNQGADGWGYQIDSTIKPTISSISEDGINCALFEFNSTGHNHTPGWEFMRFPLRPEKIQYGATYTLSFELKENMTNLNMPLIFLIATPSSTNLLTEKLTSSQVTEEGKWVGFSFTFRASATGSTGSGQYICIHIPAEYRGKIQTLYVRNMMLTPGNQAVPWSKAPEDVVAEQITVLNDNISQISQTADRINLSVTEITENVSNIDNEISNINDDINNIEDDIRSHAALIEENRSKIDQTAEQIRLEVSAVSTALNNTIDNIGQRVETNESKISSLEIGVEGITAEVAQIKSDGTELSSKIEQTAESISLKVKELGITPINYAHNTKTPKVLDTLKNISNQTFALYDVTGLSAGDVISLSFIIRVKDIIFDSHDGTVTSYIAAQFDKNYGYGSVRVRLNESNFANITPASDGYKKLKVESTNITIPQVIYGTDTPITPDVVSQIMLRLDYIDSETRTDINGNITDIGIIEISEFKIEKGDECTTWTSRTQDMYDELIATGLDIENRQIIATADNFTVRNNSGRVTASVDGDGNLTSNALLCREDNADTFAKYTTTINRLKNGWIEIFYPNGNTQFEIGWNGSSMFRFYDEQGALLWEIGSGAQFNVPTGDTTVISPVTYYKCSASNENSAITEIKTENSLPTVTLYKKVTQSSSNGSHSIANITYYTNKECTIPAEGFYADGGIPKLTLAENDNTSEYYRNLYQFINGIIHKTTEITF